MTAFSVPRDGFCLPGPRHFSNEPLPSPPLPALCVTVSWLEYAHFLLGVLYAKRAQNNNNHNNRGAVPSLQVNGLRMSPKSSVSRGHIAVFSAEASDDEDGSGGRKSLGLASGGEGLAWREGALQNVKLGGTTKLEGDLDMGGHRLLNIDLDTPDLEHIEVRAVPASRIFREERSQSGWIYLFAALQVRRLKCLFWDTVDGLSTFNQGAHANFRVPKLTIVVNSRYQARLDILGEFESLLHGVLFWAACGILPHLYYLVFECVLLPYQTELTCLCGPIWFHRRTVSGKK